MASNYWIACNYQMARMREIRMASCRIAHNFYSPVVHNFRMGKMGEAKMGTDSYPITPNETQMGSNSPLPSSFPMVHNYQMRRIRGTQMGTDSQMPHSYWIVHNLQLAEMYGTQRDFNSQLPSNYPMGHNCQMGRMSPTQTSAKPRTSRLQEIQSDTNSPKTSNWTSHNYQLGRMEESQMAHNSRMAEMLFKALQVASHLWAMIVAVTHARTPTPSLILKNLGNNQDKKQWNTLIWNKNQLGY